MRTVIPLSILVFTCISVASGQTATVQEQKQFEQKSQTSSPREDHNLMTERLKKINPKKTIVGIFSDPQFEGHQVPENLTFEHFNATWGKDPNVELIALDAIQLHSYSLLFQSGLDIIVFPYGGRYPMDAYPVYTGNTFEAFTKKGGSILVTGEIPFSEPVNNNNDAYEEALMHMADMNTVVDRWLSRFGIKYYKTKKTPDANLINKAYLPSVRETDFSPSQYGLIGNNSSHSPRPAPPHGNVFPERYPVKQVIPLISGLDGFGKVVSNNALLIQDYERGSTQIYFTHEKPDHPLAPNQSFTEELMTSLLSLLSNKVMVKDVRSELACYRKGESVSIDFEVVNHGSTRAQVALELYIKDELGNVVFKVKKEVDIPENTVISRKWKWDKPNFQDDLYSIELIVTKDEKRISQGSNGFVVWDEDVIQNQPKLTIKNQYFDIGDRRGNFISGTNYYESSLGEIMWYKPNVQNIISDFERMKISGINYIRPHYHHLKWFKDYLQYHHGELPSFYSDLEDYNDPLPNEKVWRIWDMFIYLSQKNGIIYGGDLFTLVPSEMGDPRGWFGTTDVAYSPSKWKLQREFLKALELRYKDVRGISWDLFNEPFYIPSEDLETWGSYLKEAISPERLITIGGPHDLDTVVDYLAPHGLLTEADINTQNRPMLLQEFWLDVEEDLASEIEQAEGLRYYYTLVLRNGYAGICPWSWSRQMRLWQDSYEHHHTHTMEKWDDRLGLHTHDDGTFKPAGQVFKDMSILLKQTKMTSYDSSELRASTHRGYFSTNIDSADNRRICTLYEVTEQGDLYSGMDYRSLVNQNQTIATTTSNTYLYIFTYDNLTLSKSKHFFVKSEDPTTIIINRNGQGLEHSRMVDFNGDKFQLMGEIRALDTNDLRFEIPAGKENYWIELKWK